MAVLGKAGVEAGDSAFNTNKMQYDPSYQLYGQPLLANSGYNEVSAPVSLMGHTFPT